MPDGDVANHQLEKPHTSRAAKPPADQPGMLSIEALARHRLVCTGAQRSLERARYQANKLAQQAGKPVPTPLPTGAENLLLERDTCLRDLITTLQARTMEDALIQLALIQELLDASVDYDVKRDELDLEDFAAVLVDVRKVVRLATSITSVIAARCGKNPTELVDTWCLERSESQFTDVERAMGEAA